MARRLDDAYTRYPRPLLWLVRGGVLCLPGPGGEVVRRDIDSFYISKLPVSNRQFEAYDPGYLRAPASAGDDDPAIGIALDSARGYAAWYAEVSRKAMRLATVDEWRWATIGEDGWPAGQPIDDIAWHAGNAGPQRLPPLTGRRHNAHGLYGLLGGVWEWCVDGAGAGVLCGGSWRCAASRLDPLLAVPASGVTSLSDVGFRIVKPLRG